jgi:hypothetical protein
MRDEDGNVSIVSRPQYDLLLHQIPIDRFPAWVAARYNP